MISLTLRDILKHTGGSIVQGRDNIILRNVVTKSGRIRTETLFIHYRKNKIDWKSVKLDHTNAVITETPAPFLKQVNKDVTIVKVSDIKQSYWAFIDYYRSLFNIPVIGITGTCGKTTTTELIKTILSPELNIQSTKNGKNGLSLNLPYLLGINEKTQAAVIEMGVSCPGDLVNTCRHFKPQIGVILNIGKYHLKYCKTADNYIRAKARLIRGMSPSGTLLLNCDDENIKKLDLSGFRGKTVYFGLDDKADFKAENIKYSSQGMDFTVKYKDGNYPCYIPGLGLHNVYNALAALAVSICVGIEIQSAIETMSKFKPIRQHLQFLPGPNGCTIIDDTWNCTPPSVESALKVLRDTAGGKKKIAVMGYMPQLGTAGFSEYDRIGESVVQTGVDFLIIIGNEAKRIGVKALERGLKTAQVRFCQDGADLYKALNPHLNNNSLILFKFPYKYRLRKMASFRAFLNKIFQS